MPKDFAGFQDQRPSATQSAGHASQSGKDEGLSEAQNATSWYGDLGLRPDCCQSEGHAPVGGGSMKKSEQ